MTEENIWKRIYGREYIEMIPLSTRMRPDRLEDFEGQEHFLYKGSLFYNSIKNKTFDSAVFFGPSGTGKTTLARIIASEMDSGFTEINASVTGTKELKTILENAKVRFFGLQKEVTYLYVDEFHRWNKLQQDSLLKALEEGVIRFIGSTTENPYFSINNAVLSRVRNIYEFKPLSPDSILRILLRTLSDREKGFGGLEIRWEEDALKALSEMCSGDARIAVDTLGYIVDNLDKDDIIDLSVVGEAMQRQTLFYDRKEDRYDLLSALQKSIRGSDPDAAIHYLARLIEGSGDIQLIARRLLVIASEDVGMAYPSAISIVNSCVQAALTVGLPEARINLAQAVILLSAAPKSNSSIVAIDAALSHLRSRNISDIPAHLRDAHYSGAKDRGLGEGYLYPHQFGGYVKQQYLPDSLYESGTTYYHPTENGNEKAFKEQLERLKKLYDDGGK